jgi:hypothetical protein
VFDPAHESFREWDPCPICNGDVRGFSSRLHELQPKLLKPLGYAHARASHLMALLWWYWTTMNIVQASETAWMPPGPSVGPDTAGAGADGGDAAGSPGLPAGAPSRPPQRARHQGRQRVRAHRDRKRGTVRSYEELSVVSPFFTGDIAIEQSDRFHAELTPSHFVVRRGLRRITSPPLKRPGRPSSSQEPSLLVRLAAATVLHRWFPRRRSPGQAPYLAWRWIGGLLREFTPPSAPLGFTRQASLQRKVRAYRKDPSVQQWVSRLDSTILPAILRAFRKG